MFLKNVKYVLSAPSKNYWLDSNRKEICLVGRSNVGKSTLINKLTNNKNMAKVSSTPGYTKYLNFFDVNQAFYLVDTPGYGYAKASWTRDKSFADMMHEYMYERENLICIILVIDAKVGLTPDDEALINMAFDAKRQIQIVASKADKINQSAKSKLLKQLSNSLNEDVAKNVILYSSLDNHSVLKVVERILQIYTR